MSHWFSLLSEVSQYPTCRLQSSEVKLIQYEEWKDYSSLHLFVPPSVSLSSSFQVWLINCYPSAVFKNWKQIKTFIFKGKGCYFPALWPSVLLKETQ